MTKNKLFYRQAELPDVFGVSLNTVKAWKRNGTLNLEAVEIPSTTGSGSGRPTILYTSETVEQAKQELLRKYKVVS